jgi:hypothetical protein
MTTAVQDIAEALLAAAAGDDDDDTMRRETEPPPEARERVHAVFTELVQAHKRSTVLKALYLTVRSDLPDAVRLREIILNDVFDDLMKEIQAAK